MSIFRSILDPILDTLRDEVMHKLYDESIKIIKEEERKQNLIWEKKLLTLHNDLKGWIENDIPIPNYIKKEYPFNIADYCVQANKPHWVKELLPAYYKQLKVIKKRDRTERFINGIFILIKIAIITICISFILLLLYSIIFGKPHFMGG